MNVFDPDATQPIIPITDTMLEFVEDAFQKGALPVYLFPPNTVGTPYRASEGPGERFPVGAQRAAPDNAPNAADESFLPLSNALERGAGGEVSLFRDMPASHIIDLENSLTTFLRTAYRHHLNHERWYDGLTRLADILRVDIKKHHGL